MKRKPKYDLILFTLLMVLGLMPMLQGWLHLIPIKPLSGVAEETERPVFHFDTYRSGDYARQAEAYTSKNFGFRESCIRIYNQYLWTCYRKTYAQDVVAGKKGWLYYPQSVTDYYGQELLRWHPSVDEAQSQFDKEVKYLNWARSILKENGTELMVFMAPEKGFLYPEFLPDRQHDTTSFNAREYFDQRFAETEFPCIEMTRWFLQMKDTVNYPLIPQTGAHWVFPAVYAADSLFRFMGSLNNTKLPRIEIGPLYEVKNHPIDNDLEHLLNLTFPLRHQYGFSPRAKVTIKDDSTTVKPKVLFIGNSYFWAFASYIPLEKVFDETEFWYYFSTAYSGDSLTNTSKINDLDLIEKFLNFDYMVWFTTGNQMNKGTSGFATSVLLNLCFDNSQIYKAHNRLIDSLKCDSLTLLTLDTPLADSNDKALFMAKANQLILSHPERYFPELASDSLPKARNPRIKEVLAINEIKKDSVWMWNLSTCQTVIQNAPIEKVLLMEAHNIIEGKPLMRDMTDVEAKRDQVEYLVSNMVDELHSRPSMIKQIQEKAQKNGFSIEEQTILDARWIVNERIKKGTITLK